MIERRRRREVLRILCNIHISSDSSPLLSLRQVEWDDDEEDDECDFTILANLSFCGYNSITVNLLNLPSHYLIRMYDKGRRVVRWAL